MNSIKKARKTIEAAPEDPASKILASLVMALESESAFDLALLYSADLKTFELAIEILREWRIDRYFLGKMKLMDIVWQQRALTQPPVGDGRQN